MRNVVRVGFNTESKQRKEGLGKVSIKITTDKLLP